MFGRIKKKLKSEKGETITETLVSVLIAAAAMILFASMITASQRILTKSEGIMEAYYDGNSAMEMAAARKTGVDIKSGTSTVICQDSGSGATSIAFWLSNRTGAASDGIPVQYYTNQKNDASTEDTEIKNFSITEYVRGN